MFAPHRSMLTGTGGTLAVALLLALGCATNRSQPLVSDAAKQQAVARYNLGNHHLSEGNTALAIREFQAALESNPRDPWIHLAIAEGYRRKAKLKESEQHLLEALTLNPKFHQARLSLSALYIQTARYAEAVEHAQILVDDPTFPTPWGAHTNLGYALFKLGRNAEARSHLQVALDYRPYYWRAALNLAMLEDGEGHKLEAIRLLQRVLEMRPGPFVESEVNYRLGEIYVSLGRREEAVTHLSRSVASVPNGMWGKRSEQYLKLLE